MISHMPSPRAKSRGRFAAALAALVLSAPLAAQSPASFLGYTTTVPATWTFRTPSSSLRLAEYVVPGDAEVVVYFFGPQMASNVEANLTRWRGQFSMPDGSKPTERIASDSVSGMLVTTAEFTGTYRRGIGAGSADSVKTGQTLIASIVPTSKGTLFIQLFGPSVAVADQRAAFLSFVKGLK